MRRRKNFSMETIWKLASPVSPALLVLPAALLAFLGPKYFGDPVGTTAADSISLASPAAITDMRVVDSIFLALGFFSMIEYIAHWLKNALFAPALARGGVDNKEESAYSMSWSTNLQRIWRRHKQTSGRG